MRASRTAGNKKTNDYQYMTRGGGGGSPPPTMSSWLGRALRNFAERFGSLEPGQLAKLFVAVQFEDENAPFVVEKLFGKAAADRIFANENIGRYRHSESRKADARGLPPQLMAQRLEILEADQWRRLLTTFDMCIGAGPTDEREKARRQALIAFARNAPCFGEFRAGLASDPRLSANAAVYAVDLFLLMHQRSANLRYILTGLEISGVDPTALYDYLYNFKPKSPELLRQELARLMAAISVNELEIQREMKQQQATTRPKNAVGLPPATEVVVYSAGAGAAHRLPHIDAFRTAVLPRAILPGPTVEWLYLCSQLQQYPDLYALTLEDADHPAIGRCKEYRAAVLLNESSDASIADWNAFADYKFATPLAPKRAKRLSETVVAFHSRVVEPNSSKQKLPSVPDHVKLQRYLLVYTPRWQQRWKARHTQMGEDLEQAIIAYQTSNPSMPADVLAELRAVYFE